ncbi:MSC_0775 family lipoprotein [Mycoplasma sp. 4423]
MFKKFKKLFLSLSPIVIAPVAIACSHQATVKKEVDPKQQKRDEITKALASDKLTPEQKQDFQNRIGQANTLEDLSAIFSDINAVIQKAANTQQKTNPEPKPGTPLDPQQVELKALRAKGNADNKTKLTNETLFLRRISDYFKYNDVSSQVLQFKANTNASNITFKNLSNNNYITDYLDFNDAAFTQILKDKKLVTDEQAAKLSYEYDYHNIRQDINNNNDIIIPMKILIPVEATGKNLNLKAETKVNFVLKGIKLSTSDEKNYKDVNDLSKKLQNLTQGDAIKISIKDKSDPAFAKIQALIDDKSNAIYSFDDLNRKQLASMFNLTYPDFSNLLSPYKNKQIIKIFIDDVNFTHSPKIDQLTVKIRIANGYDNTQKGYEKFPFANVGFNKIINLTFDKDNTVLRDEKIRANLLAKPANWNIYNQNFEEQGFKDNVSDITILPINYDFKYLKDSFKSTDYRNGYLTFTAIYDGKIVKLQKHIGVGKFAEIFDSNFMQANPHAYNFHAGHLTYSDLSRVNQSIYNDYGSNLFSGGYDSTRSFYLDDVKTPIAIHVGEDYLAKEHTPVIAPYDGEVVAVYNAHLSNAQIKTGQGVGTVMLTRVKLTKLNLSPKILQEYFGTYDTNDDRWVYIGFIHLDANLTMNNKTFNWSPKTITIGKDKSVRVYDILDNVSPAHPQPFKKGDTLAYLGTSATNGGWMPHVHVTTYANNTLLTNDNDFQKALTSANLYGERVEKYNPQDPKVNPFTARVDGIYIARNTDIEAGKKPIFKVDPITGTPTKDTVPSELLRWVSNPIQGFEIRRSVFDPNILFKIRGPQSYRFDIEDFFRISDNK